jgi:uncharacterized membrane protein YhaH (DUF805 family)
MAAKGCAMLGFLFGFNARLGRMQFFLATIGLAVVMTAICFAMASYFYPYNPRAALPSAQLIGWPVIVAGLGFAYMTITLQSMRIRDIGWDPVCVIPAWVAILIVDKLVANKLPALAYGHDAHGTLVGAAVNLLFLALMFWPGGEYGAADPGGAGGKPDKPARGADAASVAAARLARASGADFGRPAF